MPAVITPEQALALVGVLIRYEAIGVDANGEEVTRRDTERFLDALVVADPSLAKILQPFALLPYLPETDKIEPLRNRRLLGLFLRQWGDKLLVAGKENPPPRRNTREILVEAFERLDVRVAVRGMIGKTYSITASDLATDLAPLIDALSPL